MAKLYYIIATDTKYYATEGETKEVVGSTPNRAYALKEAERIRKANPWGASWVEDEQGNVVE